MKFFNIGNTIALSVSANPNRKRWQDMTPAFQSPLGYTVIKSTRMD